MESKKRNMTESMKFGPEWLRSATDNCNASNSKMSSAASLTAPRYQLAEHRYGREEMLALFDQSYKAPDMLESFSTIYIEKPQLPLALLQMTEEETRLWNGGITSTGTRGRGGSVDRGGRGGRSRGGLYTHPRGVGFDDSGEGSRLEAQAFSSRSRPFERSQSERGWSERNGASEAGDWNGSTSPRKEPGRGASGSSLMENNWRRQRSSGDEEEGWRIMNNSRGEKWGGKTNWREAGSERDRGDGDTEEGRPGGRWEHRGNHRNYDSSNPSHRKPWDSNHHDNHDNLPEWVTENPGESGGSFDALGAFHGGMYSDDDEDPRDSEGRTRRSSEGNSGPVKSQSTPKMFNYANSSTPSSRQQTVVKDKPTSQASTGSADERESVEPAAPAKTTAPKGHTPLKTSMSEPKIAKSKHFEAEKKPEPVPVAPKVAEVKEAEKPKLIEPHQRIVPAMRELAEIELAQNVNAIIQKTEFPLDRMKEEADALVAKLMADETTTRKEAPPTVVPPQPPMDKTQEKWFYRDPQGEVQGPFTPAEMAEWCKQGYFTANLMVRRSCDERYTTLGELITLCGRVPFKPGPPIPPLKASEPVIPTVATPVPGGLPPSSVNKPGMENSQLLVLQQQLHQLQMFQNQMMLGQMRNVRKNVAGKLSQSEQWASLSPIEQTQLIAQYVAANQHSEFPEIPVPAAPFVTPPMAAPPANPVMQLINQMQQAKPQPDNHIPTSPLPTAHHPTTPMDPLQQLISGAAGAMPNIPTIPPTNLSVSPQDDNPLKMLFRQLSGSNNHPPPMSVDPVWPQPPPPHVAAPFPPAQNWMPPVGAIPTISPGQMPASLWDVQCKDIEREQQQQHLDKQNCDVLETKRKEELKKQEELKKKAEEEYAKKKCEEEQARIAEENKKKKEEEKKRREEEKRRVEEEHRKKEERKRKEDEKKREEKRKQEEELLLRKKQEEERKKKEEFRKQEERKKEEEKRKQMEEEARLEAERIKNEEAMRKKLELEEQNRKAEQRRREMEALRKLQERSKAPWAQAPQAQPSSNASLVEIQKLEREKKAEEQRMFQQLQQQQLQQQQAHKKQMQLAMESTASDSSKRLQFKWAEKANSSERLTPVKSFAQIQQEEQDRIAKVKQQEKEKHQEKAAALKESVVSVQSTGIWGTASQTLSWNSSSSSASLAWNSASSTGGFWEDTTVPKNSQPVPKAATKQTPVKAPPTPVQQLPQPNSKVAKSKNKKDEELVKKLFEQNTVKTDDFTQWCNKALAGLQVSVDIPTFVGFLRDIESPYEVKEYVRLYLGDGRQCGEFAKQFLEKRSKWRSAQRPQVQADDLCKPAPAVNPNACTEFQEVKGKSKKVKKGKMFKVDNRILGFSVTSAPDRINVGDRDYGDSM